MRPTRKLVRRSTMGRTLVERTKLSISLTEGVNAKCDVNVPCESRLAVKENCLAPYDHVRDA